MLPYLHILVRVEEDGSLRALGAFTSKEKQKAYQEASGLTSSQVRLDFYNGPFNETTKVVYTGHRRWNMDSFQLGGYFLSEGEAWNSVTQEGYVSVLHIDILYEDELKLEAQALDQYAKLQKKWRLSTYEELVAKEGSDKARANIMLRFYEDALQSFKPKTRRELRALYAFICLLPILPIAILAYLDRHPKYAENVDTVKWLPDTASNISYYRSSQVQVYEFKIPPEDYKKWAALNNLTPTPITQSQTLSRYKAYIPANAQNTNTPNNTDTSATTFKQWQNAISIQLTQGLIATNPQKATTLYDPSTRTAYYEQLQSP